MMFAQIRRTERSSSSLSQIEGTNYDHLPPSVYLCAKYQASFSPLGSTAKLYMFNVFKIKLSAFEKVSHAMKYPALHRSNSMFNL